MWEYNYYRSITAIFHGRLGTNKCLRSARPLRKNGVVLEPRAYLSVDKEDVFYKMRWLGFVARIDAILHKFLHPTHNVRWRTNEGSICPGDIVCETCNHVFWCRLLNRRY